MTKSVERTLKSFASNRKAIAVLAIAIIIFAGATYSLQSASYVTAYQGAKTRYVGVKDLVTGKVYTNTQKQKASVAWFDSTLAFDIDEAKAGKPNLAGEMTSVFIPKSDAGATKDWVPTSWWRDAMLWNNPTGTPHEWSVKNADGTTSYYRMEEWNTKWFISISAEWDLTGAEYQSALFVPDYANPLEQANKRYNDIQIWFEFDIEPTWYFEGTDNVYFAIAKIELSQIKFEGREYDGRVADKSQTVRVTPMSPGTPLTIYQNVFGTTAAPSKNDFESYYYQGVKLNPQYFRDKVYSYVTLNDFGTSQWWDWATLKAKGDVVTMGFTVTQFVVGEWKVKDIREIPDDYGRTSKVGYWGWTGLEDFFDWLGTPTGQLWMFLILIAAALVLITIFFPGFWVLVFGYFQGRRKGGGRQH